MTWETILTILASLSIPSILVSVFFYIQNRKYKKWEAKRDLELKKIEFEEEMANGDKEYVKKMAENDRGLLGSSRVANFTEAREILETSKKKLRKIGAEMDYLYKMSGEKSPLKFSTKKSLWNNVKSRLK